MKGEKKIASMEKKGDQTEKSVRDESSDSEADNDAEVQQGGKGRKNKGENCPTKRSKNIINNMTV